MNLSLSLVVLSALSISVLAGMTYEGSNCRRECKIPAEKDVVCKYSFEVEWYYSMSKACYDCPFNMSHCSLTDCIPLNGVARGVMVVNRQLPGPIIEACENDTIEVKVTNLLDNAEGLSIHWHGLHARGAPYMDGVSMLTQCPITSQASFLYSFGAYPAGTHWWHSHSGMQRADGLFGALIVRKPKVNEPYDYDVDEHVLLVNDWLHELAIDKFAAHHHSTGSNKADSVLVNGKGISRTLTKEGAMPANTTREVFRVERGKRYRFRTISGAITDCGLKISVDGHRISMIASDGAAINDQETDSFIIFAGERYDFILEANKDAKNYWIRVNGFGDCTHIFELAILRYDGQPEDTADTNPDEPEKLARTGTTVNTLQDNLNPVNDEDKSIRELTSHEQDDPAISEEADGTYYIGMDFNGINNKHFNRPDHYPIDRVVHDGQRTFTSQLNHISFALPPSPPLSQYGDIPQGTFCSENTFTNYKNCSTEYCECTHTINVTRNDIIELVVVNEGNNFDGSHPMHLHGHYFHVIGYEKIGEYTSVEDVKQMDRNGTLRREAHLSLKKDTVIVPDGGYVVLRFKADNPGWWFFHCHLVFHAEVGMALIVHVGNQDELPAAPKHFPTCGIFPSSSIISSSSSGGYMVSELHAYIIIFSIILYFI